MSPSPSGEWRLEHGPTEPCPPPDFDDEPRETLPSMAAAPVPDIEITIDFDDSELF